MREKRFEVVVAGCGVAGLSAAVAAAETGARVVVLERAPPEERGGQSRYTEAYLRMKSEAEVTDDFETHLAENSSGTLDPDLIAESARPPGQRAAYAAALSMAEPGFIATFADQAGPTIAWLKGFGLRFAFLPTQFLTKSQPRLLPVGGGLALVEGLAARAEALGVEILYDTTAERLEQDEDGQVTGLLARSRQEGRLRLGGRVVLACGGFEGNAEMLARYIGPRAAFLRPICKGAHFNRGDGIRMALDIGAATAGDFGSYHAEPIDPRSGVSEPSVFVFPYGILVNKDGRRFTDEAPGTVDAHYESITRRIFEQHDGLAYVVLDAKHRRVPNVRLAIRTDQPPIAADSLEALAVKLAVPPATLAATVRGYNAACVPGDWRPLEADGLATLGLDPPKSNWALPVDEPPFHAYPIISANVFTFGGVKVDSDARVLDGDGTPIQGLYAAGEIIGIYYRTYTGATSVLKGLVFGRLAGHHAARRGAAMSPDRALGRRRRLAMRIWHQSFSDLDLAPVYRATLARHAAAVLPSEDSVALHGLRPGTYGPDFAPIHAIRHRYLEYLNEAQVVEAALAAERADYDAFALGCFYDPALRAVRSVVDIPCVGLSETCMLVACSLGQRFGLVSLEASQRAQHEEQARGYGLRERLAGVVAMHPPIDEYSLEGNEDTARPLLEAFHAACGRLVEMGAEVVTPGDGFLNEFVWRHGLKASHGAVVMDALGTLFRYAQFMAGARASIGLQVSRAGRYARPPAAMLAEARRAAGAVDVAESSFSGAASRR